MNIGSPRGLSSSKLVVLAFICIASGSALAQLSTLPLLIPPENPITEQKRILGKMLFWDEQMSSDNTMACGTCHKMTRGGTDNRRVRHPGADGFFFNADDVFGSPGVVSTDEFGDYIPSPYFGLAPQPGNRAAPPVINAAYGVELFHDGRASSTFRDPMNPNQLTNIVIPSGGALESQAVGPLMNDIEMAHKTRTWAEIIAKLEAAKPLVLASDLTTDIAAILTPATTYSELFASAYGDSAITPVRVAMAIATYERTLISDQTPWDAYAGGNTSALTANQIAGMQHFDTALCTLCHVPPLFTDNQFNNVGLRPWQQDAGRMIVTGDIAHRGQFKSVNLRNVGLKTNYMHHGAISTLLGTIDFYKNTGGIQFTNTPDEFDIDQGQDPTMPFVVDALDALALTDPNWNTKIQDFLANALTDPRVAAGTFPFDSPTLWSLRPEHQSTILPGGVIGTDGYTPTIVVSTPAMIGNADFKMGIARALGGATARLGVSTSPPVGGRITPAFYLSTITLSGSGSGAGYGTAHWDIPNNGALAGQTRYVQWFVTDAGAPLGEALSSPARFTFFCSATLGCPPVCSADLANPAGQPLPDGGVDINDLLFLLTNFEAGSLAADLDDDGVDPALPDGGIDISDLLFFLAHFESGC